MEKILNKIGRNIWGALAVVAIMAVLSGFEQHFLTAAVCTGMWWIHKDNDKNSKDGR